MGITVTRYELDILARKVVSNIKTADSHQNACVGIGISNAKQVSEVNAYADGAIVGSAFVRAYAEGGVAALRDKVAELAVDK
jgi:tryptophan synthase alpha chain